MFNLTQLAVDETENYLPGDRAMWEVVRCMEGGALLFSLYFVFIAGNMFNIYNRAFFLALHNVALPPHEDLVTFFLFPGKPFVASNIKGREKWFILRAFLYLEYFLLNRALLRALLLWWLINQIVLNVSMFSSLALLPLILVIRSSLSSRKRLIGVELWIQVFSPYAL